MTYKSYPEKHCALCGELHLIPRNARYCNECKLWKAENKVRTMQIDLLGRKVYA